MQRSRFQAPIRVAITVVLSSCMVFAGQAGADDHQRFGEEILDILREAGRISEERYEELKALEAKEAADRENGWTLRYSNGLKFEKNDGTVKFNIGGRIQADFSSIYVQNALERAVSGGEGQGVEFRRAWLYTSGELYERIIWKSQFSFAGGDVQIRDVYIGAKGLGFLGTARVGNMKEPYSLEELTSSKYITFMERALPSAFNSARRFGLAFSNAVLEQRMTWAAGIFADSDRDGEYFSDPSRFDVMARVTGLPLYANGGKQLIHLGAAGGYQVRDDASERFRKRPEIHQAKRYVDTGDFQSDGNGILGLEVAGVYGPAHLQAEWQQTWIDQHGGKNLSFWGTYVSGGWFLTGESRPYNTSRGVWGRVEPKNPFEPSAGKWGAFEVASRFSYLNMNDANVRGGREANVTVALNWYLYSNVRLELNYVFANVLSTGEVLGTADGEVNAVMARAQLEF